MSESSGETSPECKFDTTIPVISSAAAAADKDFHLLYCVEDELDLFVKPPACESLGADIYTR